MDGDSILVVEDEAIVAIDLSSTLESIGYTVLKWLKSGEEALEFLRQAQPDLILMDIKLKGKLEWYTDRRCHPPVLRPAGYLFSRHIRTRKPSTGQRCLCRTATSQNPTTSTISVRPWRWPYTSTGWKKRLHEQQQVLDLSLKRDPTLPS